MKFTDSHYEKLREVSDAIRYPTIYFPKFRELSGRVDDLELDSCDTDTELSKKFDALLDHLGLEIEKVDYVVRKKEK